MCVPCTLVHVSRVSACVCVHVPSPTWGVQGYLQEAQLLGIFLPSPGIPESRDPGMEKLGTLYPGSQLVPGSQTNPFVPAASPRCPAARALQSGPWVPFFLHRLPTLHQRLLSLQFRDHPRAQPLPCHWSTLLNVFLIRSFKL